MALEYPHVPEIVEIFDCTEARPNCGVGIRADLDPNAAQRIIGLREGKSVVDGPASEITGNVFTDIYGQSVQPSLTRFRNKYRGRRRFRATPKFTAQGNKGSFSFNNCIFLTCAKNRI